LVTSGSLAPGASVNHLDIGGNLNMSGGSFDFEISPSTVNADLTTVLGDLTLAGASFAPSIFGADALLPITTKFTVVNYGGILTGTFASLPNLSTFVLGSNTYQIRYDDTTGGTNFLGGNYGGGIGPHFVTITAVPEASTLLTIGLGGIFAVAAVWMSKRMGVNILKS
jgi:hypothetical protein